MAERGGVTLGITDGVYAETLSTLRELAARPTGGRIRKDSDAWYSTAAGNLKRWITDYRQAGLLIRWSNRDYDPELVAGGFPDLLAEMWAQMETDPEDFHVAEAAVFCRADALCTANMNMVKDKDWLSLMESLDLAWPPQLCREENIVDCLSGKPELWRNSEWIARAALSVMYPSSRLLQSLQRWAVSIKGAFPHLSEQLEAWLSRRSEQELQQWHAQARQPTTDPVTRRYLKTKNSPPLPEDNS